MKFRIVRNTLHMLEQQESVTILDVLDLWKDSYEDIKSENGGQVLEKQNPGNYDEVITRLCWLNRLTGRLYTQNEDLFSEAFRERWEKAEKKYFDAKEKLAFAEQDLQKLTEREEELLKEEKEYLDRKEHIDVLEQRCRVMASEHEKGEQEEKSCLDKMSHMKKEVLDIQSRIKKCREEILPELTEKLDMIRTEQEEYNQQIKLKETEYRREAEETEKIKSVLQGWDKRIQTLKSEEEKIKKEVEDRRRQEKEVLDRQKEFEKQCRDMEGKIEATEAALVELQEQMETVGKKLISKEQEKNSLKKTAEKLQKKLEEKQQENAELKEINAQKWDETERLRLSMESMVVALSGKNEEAEKLNQEAKAGLGRLKVKLAKKEEESRKIHRLKAETEQQISDLEQEIINEIEKCNRVQEECAKKQIHMNEVSQEHESARKYLAEVMKQQEDMFAELQEKAKNLQIVWKQYCQDTVLDSRWTVDRDSVEMMKKELEDRWNQADYELNAYRNQYMSLIRYLESGMFVG